MRKTARSNLQKFAGDAKDQRKVANFAMWCFGGAAVLSMVCLPLYWLAGYLGAVRHFGLVGVLSVGGYALASWARRAYLPQRRVKNREQSETKIKLAHCIECGCHDLAACYEEKADGPCSWLALDRKEAKGVCSACPEALARWNGGDRTLAVPVDHDH